MFELFTDRARRVVVLAQEEARLLNHNYIGTEHMLLGVAHEGEGIAARVLHDVGATLDVLRREVAELIGVASDPPTGHVPFTPRVKKVLEGSVREMHRVGDAAIGPEHVLLALIHEGEGVGAQALVRAGVDLSDLRSTLTRTIEATPREEREVTGAMPLSSEVRLTEREIEVQRLLSEGRTLDEIAMRLSISPNTVRNHLRDIQEKVQLGTRRRARRVARPITQEKTFTIGIASVGEPVGPRCATCDQEMSSFARTAVVAVPGPGEATTDVTFLYCGHCGWILDVRWPQS